MPLKREQMIAEARESIAELSPAKVKAPLDWREIDLILDIREANEWAEAHIPGSVHAAGAVSNGSPTPVTRTT